MNKIFLILFLFLLKNFSYVATSYPLILMPKVFHFNSNEKIIVSSIDQANDEFYLLEVQDASVQGEILYKKNFKLSPNETKSINFKIEKYPSFGKVVIIIIDQTTGKSRNNIVPVTKTNGLTLVQTDKPIYTPKQEILIRILRLDKDFRPVNDDLRLQIMNPQNIIMESVTIDKNSQSSFFIDYSLSVPPSPLLGKWKVVVYQGFDQNANATFEVQEYVLPTFTIDLNTTELILKSTKKLEGNCSVQYVYGKPVKGSVTFKFGYGIPNESVEYIGKSQPKNLIDGKTSFSFDVNHFYYVSPVLLFDSFKKFFVEVEVLDHVTSKKTKKTFSKGLFSKHAFKFSFENTIIDYKPGFDNIFKAKLLYSNDKVAARVPVNIDIHEINLVKRLMTDENGFIEFIVNVDESVEFLTISLNTSDPSFSYNEQLNEIKKLKKHFSVSGGYLFLNKNESHLKKKIGVTYENNFFLKNLDHNLISSFYYFLISPSGKILHFEEKKYFEAIKFQIKEEYYPEISLIVLAIPNQNKIEKKDYKLEDFILTDSIRIEILEADDNCGIKANVLSTKSSKKFDLNNLPKFDPGETIILEFLGQVNQELSLIGVDEAIYALASNNLYKLNNMRNLYKKNSVFCGSSGGLNSYDVLVNSGLLVFDFENSTIHNKEGSLCKQDLFIETIDKKKIKNKKNKSRNKRQSNSIQETVVKYNYTKKFRNCCFLGMKVHRQYVNDYFCLEKTKIFKKHINETGCIEAFLQCCTTAQSKPTNDKTIYPAKLKVMAISDGNSLNLDSTEFVHVSEEDSKELNSIVREDFRETWLFEIMPFQEKNTTLSFKLPDSITTQSLTISSISKKRGLCFFKQNPIRFKTFKPIFLQVFLPYQAVQNEQLEMVVSVYNYHHQNVSMLVYFYGIEGICSEADPEEKSERKRLIVFANSADSIAIPLVPLQTGKFKIKVVCLSTLGTDVVVKEINVVSQGIPVEDDYTFQLDPKNKQKRAKRHISTNVLNDKIYPEKNFQLTKLKLLPNQKSQMIVPNSEHCLISAIANDYGPAISYSIPENEIGDTIVNSIKHSGNNDNSRLEHLIRKPRGCGEQTAFYYAPTLYTLIYLESTKKLSFGQKEKGLKYLKSGYKRQLMFRKTDGSFSAFPNRKSSIWLTSFIMKLFCVSSTYIDLDYQVIKSGLSYLFEKQDNNGYWSEINSVLHKQLMGGINGRVQLTASVLSNLRLCSKIEQINLDMNEKIVNSIQKAENYLKFYSNDVSKTKNAFKIALLANSLIDSYSYRNDALKLLEILFTLTTTEEEKNIIYWKDDYPIEVASLVLLSLSNIENQKLSLSLKLNSQSNQNKTYLKSSFTNNKILEDKKFIDNFDSLTNKVNTQSIVNYLNSQKTFSGGFDNTQETILALNALADNFRNQINYEQISMNLNCDISLTNNRFKRSLQFNNENALVMKRLQFNKDDIKDLINEELVFHTSGNGSGIVSVKLKYNVLIPEKLCKFDLEVSLEDWRFDNNKAKKDDKVIQKGNNDKQEVLNDLKKINSSDILSDKNLYDDLLKDLDLFEDEKKLRKKRNFESDYRNDEILSNDIYKNEKFFINKELEKDFLHLEQFDDVKDQIILNKINEKIEKLNKKNNVMTLSENDRQKRSILKNIVNFAKRSKRKNPPLIKYKTEMQKEDNIRIIYDNSASETKKDQLLSNKAIYRLKICVQHIPNHDSEMSIIEIGLLTGYEVDKEDLLSKVYSVNNNNPTNNMLSKVEFSSRKVILYLDSVSFERPNCYSLKLYHGLQVSNIQSAVVKIYDYYRKDDICTTLYSPSTIENLNVTCFNEACVCSVKKNCPNNQKLVELYQISERKFDVAKKKLESLICQEDKFSYVFKGKIKGQKLVNGNLFMKVEVVVNYREKTNLTDNIVIALNQECSSLIDLKLSEESYIFFLNGTQDFLYESDLKKSLISFQPSRHSMIYGLSNTFSSNEENKFFNKIIRSVELDQLKGAISC